MYLASRWGLFKWVILENKTSDYVKYCLYERTMLDIKDVGFFSQCSRFGLYGKALPYPNRTSRGSEASRIEDLTTFMV